MFLFVINDYAAKVQQKLSINKQKHFILYHFNKL